LQFHYFVQVDKARYETTVDYINFVMAHQTAEEGDTD